MLVMVGLAILSACSGAANQNTNEGKAIEGYQGKVLAGTTTPYIAFTDEDFQKAQNEGKTIFINFYANWCPTCKREQVDIFRAFDELEESNVVGFRVNFRDSDTDNIEKELATRFNAAYQHTKVILDKNASEKFNALQVMNKEEIKALITQMANRA